MNLLYLPFDPSLGLSMLAWGTVAKALLCGLCCAFAEEVFRPGRFALPFYFFHTLPRGIQHGMNHYRHGTH
ncbi:MAG: hypothetical protein AAFR61_30685 [Bacteroidota bacterium]